MNPKKHLRIIVCVTILNALDLTIVLPLFLFFTALVFGALSDRYGRKPILILSLIGSVIGCLLYRIRRCFWDFVFFGENHRWINYWKSKYFIRLCFG